MHAYHTYVINLSARRVFIYCLFFVGPAPVFFCFDVRGAAGVLCALCLFFWLLTKVSGGFLVAFSRKGSCFSFFLGSKVQ